MKNSMQYNKITSKPTLILDLDQTMIFASKTVLDDMEPSSIFLDSAGGAIYIYVRPYAEFFLEHLHNVYELIVFTSGKKEYAEHIVSTIDPNGQYIKAIYSREHCTNVQNFFVKDLDILDLDLQRTVIIDDSLISFAFHIDNGLLIEAWKGEARDMCLLRMTPFLKDLSSNLDIRKAIREKTTNYRYVFGTM